MLDILHKNEFGLILIRLANKDLCSIRTLSKETKSKVDTNRFFQCKKSLSSLQIQYREHDGNVNRRRLNHMLLETIHCIYLLSTLGMVYSCGKLTYDYLVERNISIAQIILLVSSAAIVLEYGSLHGPIHYLHNFILDRNDRHLAQTKIKNEKEIIALASEINSLKRLG
jgi:hypothetical protein